MISKQKKNAVAAAALSGLMLGATASMSGCQESSEPGTHVATPGTQMAPHSCKGMNTCKGQGGCKASDNGCKGKNTCKGKGGCEVKA